MAGNLARYIAGTCTQPHAGPPTTPLSLHLAYIFFDVWRLERVAHTRRRHRDLPLAQLVDELWSITLPASCMWARRLKASQSYGGSQSRLHFESLLVLEVESRQVLQAPRKC